MSDTPVLATVSLEWNDLTFVTLSNLTNLQRVNLQNNQLQTLDVSFDPMLTYLNISDNYMLTDLRTEGDTNLNQIVGEWSDWD